jgi:sulfite exporter TauE/SafE/plastocyanin
MISPGAAFITGLTTGGLTCMAVQGGLLLGILARRRADGQPWRWPEAVIPVTGFLIAKLIVYMIAGGLLGWLGSKVQLSVMARLWFQAIAAVLIIIAGIRIRWPNFMPWITPQLPAGVRRLVRRGAKWDSLAAPVALGFLTILIPCGTTQAMEVAAMSTGQAATGAAILGAFVLGTAPLFFLVGIAAKGVTLFQQKLAWVAATVVVLVGLYSFNGVLVSIDSPLSWQNQMAGWGRVMHGQNQLPDDVATDANPIISVQPNGYAPSEITVPVGRVVNLTLRTDGNTGCTSVFRIPKLAINKTLPPTGDTVVSTTFPSPGRYTFTCGMGMYTGIIMAV